MDDKAQYIKVRKCKNNKHCIFKNVWWDAFQCLAKFHVWHTCYKKGREERTKRID